MFSTKRFDQVERVAEHVLRHARVHNQLAGDDRYAGGSGDRSCYHGVSDIFRIPKPAAGFYRSQCDPSEEVVLEPGFFWSSGDHSGAGGPGKVPICSNCDRLKVYVAGALKKELDPDREHYGNLVHPPFQLDLSDLPLKPWGDLRIEGYLGGKKVITKTYSGNGVDVALEVRPDDLELEGDGIDATRVVLRIVDEYGEPCQFSTGAVSLAIEGPGEIVGENPFGLVGGIGAVWIKTKEGAGKIRLHAKHQALGTKTVEIQVKPSRPETI